jgi:WD40 repeat protein
MYTVGDNNTVLTWDLTGDRTLVTRMPHEDRHFGSAVARLSPDGRRLAFDEPLSGEALLDLTTGHRTKLLHQQRPYGDQGDWSPDSSRYAIAHWRAVDVVDRSGRLVTSRKVVGPHAVVTGVGYSPDGDRLVVSGSDGHIGVLDAATLLPAGPDLLVAGNACCLSVARQGTTAVVLAGRSQLRRGEEPGHDSWVLLDWATGTVLRQAAVDHDAGLVSLSPDGSMVGVATHRQMEAFDAVTGEPLGAPRAQHLDDISWIIWSSDSRGLVTGDVEGRVVLWDARTSAPQEQLDIPATAVYPAYLPDGRLIIPTTDGSVYVWDPSLRHAEEFACRLAGRDLTQDEWSQAFGDRPYEPACPT